MDNISFKSRIRPAGFWEFASQTRAFEPRQYVNYPWTVKESVISNKAITKNVFDCTVCGITDGLKVLMMHICPTIKINHDFSKIVAFIKDNINLQDSNLQGFLFGSVTNFQDGMSGEIFGSFESFLKEHSIPYSKIRGSRDVSDVAYSSEKDEWLIRSNARLRADINETGNGALNFLKENFDEVKISELDEVCW